MLTLVLASASPARLGVLRAAGLDPVVRSSGIDENALIAALAGAAPAAIVTSLARAKADAVAVEVAGEYPDVVVVGCDSMLYIGGELVGKPATAEAAALRWQQMAGGTGDLLTGHAVLRCTGGEVIGVAGDAERTVIRFGTPSPTELDAYVASGEPMQVAGGFTLDGLGGWFVDGVDGNPSSVIGISLPLTRRLLAEVGVPVTSLWGG